MTHDPATLEQRIQSRDVNALASYLEHKRPQLLAFIERQLGAQLRRKMEPDDIYQDVSIEAIRALPTTTLGDRDPFSWLCQIAEHKIIDAHRRFFDAQKRDGNREVPLAAGQDNTHNAGLIQVLVASMTTASKAFSRNQKEIRLLAALEELPEENREALRLRYLEGLPSKEIAQRLGKTDGAVRVMLTRSLSRLQQILGPDGSLLG